MNVSPSPQALFSELDPELVRCPYPLYSRFRENDPAFVDDIKAFVVTRFDDVQAIISDAKTFKSAEVRGPVSLEAMGETLGGLAASDPEMAALMEKNMFMTRFLLAADDEDHRRRRSLVQKAFTPRRIRALEPDIREICDRLIDDFDPDSTEFVSSFSIPLPVEVIARAIGVAGADVSDFKKWSDDLFAPMGVNRPSPELMSDFLRSQDEFINYFSPRIESRRESPSDDLLQDLLNAEEDGESLTRPESLLMCAELVAAGNETTTSMLTSAMQLLGSHPELTNDLREDPSGIPGFVEEVLRLEGPIQAFYRTAAEDTEVGGTKVPKGTALLCIYGSANRDPEQFEDPEQVKCGRENAKSHLAFGRGPHACVGSLLARTEGRIAVEALLGHLSNIQILRKAGPGEYTDSYMLRGARRLDVTYEFAST